MSPRPSGRTTPPAIVACADDYGLYEAGDAVILDLLRDGAINATACLVEADAWPRAAARLHAVLDERPGLAVGLHLNLTQTLPGCAAPEALASAAVHLVQAFGPRTEDREAAALTAMRGQWSGFVAAFGRAPDFIDGHEHVHLTPTARRALFRLIAETRFSGWIRQCRTSSGRLIWKRAVLDPLSAAVSLQARACGLVCNPGFGGLRRFRPDEDVERLWRTDLAAMRSGGLLMVHPGAATPDDPIGAARAQEAGLLKAGALHGVLARLGFSLAGDARHPW